LLLNDQKPVSTVFQDENFYTFLKKYPSLLYGVFHWVTPGQSTTSWQLPKIIWNIYYDSKKLLPADNCQ